MWKLWGGLWMPQLALRPLLLEPKAICWCYQTSAAESWDLALVRRKQYLLISIPGT